MRTRDFSEWGVDRQCTFDIILGGFGGSSGGTGLGGRHALARLSATLSQRERDRRWQRRQGRPSLTRRVGVASLQRLGGSLALPEPSPGLRPPSPKGRGTDPGSVGKGRPSLTVRVGVAGNRSMHRLGGSLALPEPSPGIGHPLPKGEGPTLAASATETLADGSGWCGGPAAARREPRPPGTLALPEPSPGLRPPSPKGRGTDTSSRSG